MTQTENAPVQRATRLSDEESRRFQARWDEIQAGFVADPRAALAHADDLVGDAVEAMTQRIHEERRALRGRWHPEETPTESLRVSMQGYRELFSDLAG
jgi:hypothetical protein